MAKIKLFTHDDLDGIGCFLVFDKLLETYNYVVGEKYKYDLSVTFNSYRTIDRNITDYLEYLSPSEYDSTVLVISDISCNKETADRLSEANRRGLSIQLLDHHPTATWLNEYSWARVEPTVHHYKDTLQSGTMMMMTFLRREFVNYGSGIFKLVSTIPYGLDSRFVEAGRKTLQQLYPFAMAVDMWDTWTWTKNKPLGLISRDLNILLQALKRDSFINWFHMRYSEYPGLMCIQDIREYWLSNEIANALISSTLDQITHKLRLCSNRLTVERDDEGHTYGIVCLDYQVSLIGNMLCEEEPFTILDYIKIIDLDRMVISMRTVKDDIDLGKIAQKFGGGGHKQAASYQIAEDDVYTDIVTYMVRNAACPRLLAKDKTEG